MSNGTRVLPVYGERALTIGKVLAVADLHIGIEHALNKQGVMIPSQTGVMMKKLVYLIEKCGVEELIILGDFKHNIPSTSMHEFREIPRLMDSLSKLVDVSIIKGNHDGMLDRLIPGVPIHDYIERDGVILTHGHAWIKTKSLDSSVMVLAHNHPAVAFKDEQSRTIKEPAWIKGRFNERIKEYYRDGGLSEFILMPAFNSLISGIAFNQLFNNKPLGPYFNSGVIEIGSAHAYLLDGTDLGPLSRLKTAEEKTK